MIHDVKQKQACMKVHDDSKMYASVKIFQVTYIVGTKNISVYTHLINK